MAIVRDTREGSSVLGWVAVGLGGLGVLGLGLLCFRLVEDRDRQWDLGVLPDTPGESIYSTERPPVPPRVRMPGAAPVPPQVVPLPEAVPWERPEEAP